MRSFVTLAALTGSLADRTGLRSSGLHCFLGRPLERIRCGTLSLRALWCMLHVSRNIFKWCAEALRSFESRFLAKSGFANVEWGLRSRALDLGFWHDWFRAFDG